MKRLIDSSKGGSAVKFELKSSFGSRKKILAYSLLVSSVTFLTPVTGYSETLNVGLYPYVPRLDQFQAAVQSAWDQQGTGITLNFVSSSVWDGGYSTLPTDLDVFVFDAMYLNEFKDAGYLTALEASDIDDVSDFFPYAIDGVKIGSSYYAIPLLGCGNILFYNENDTELANATTFSDVTSALNQCKYTGQVAPEDLGMMLDMSGGTTTATYYIEFDYGETGTYPIQLPTTIEDDLIDEQRTLLETASFRNGRTSFDFAYQRGQWFSEGYGRAVIAYTEAMSAMSDATLETIAFKPMPFSDTERSPIFYSDVIAVNPSTSDPENALKLANIMGNAATVVDSLGATQGNDRPQYLMATRPSVFDTIGASFPIYNDMKAMVDNNDPKLFALPSDARAWFDEYKGTIADDVTSDFPCGCDYTATQTIPDNAGAPSICEATCSAHGGWNGNWTNAQPYAPDGSVCGCNACNVSASLTAPVLQSADDKEQ